jgi:hypothetical protein
MKKKILLLVLCAVLAACALAACSENTKQKAIATDTSGAVVEGNGGMAVKYGDYVYFVNGYAGESALNTFGDVVKGAICRVTLVDGVPDYKTVKTIVPKNVYGSDTTYGGIYIVNGYIYYNTTSVDKDSDRNYKTTEGVITRTSLDGSKTENLKNLDTNAVVLYAGDNSNYVAYVFSSYIYLINTETKDITTITKSTESGSSDDQTAVAYKCAGDYIVYTMYNNADKNNSTSDYLVNVLSLIDGKATTLMSSDIYNGNTDRAVLYTTTVTDMQSDADGFTMFYTKTDNTTNGIYGGYYSYSFSKDNLVFDKSKEVRYSKETSTTTYTKFYKLANGYVLAFSKTLLDVYDDTGAKIVKTSYDQSSEGRYVSFDLENEVTMINVYETDTEVFAYYLYSSKFYYVKLFDKANGVYTAAEENTVAFFSGTYNSTYLSYDILENVIYYFNDDMEDNAYYYVIPDFASVTTDTDIATGKILGVISDTDMIALIGETTTDDD